METDKRKMSGRTLFVAAFVIVTSAVLFTGCDYFLKKAETTPSTSMQMTEETTTSSTAETTAETTEITEPETTMTYETFPVTEPVPLVFSRNWIIRTRSMQSSMRSGLMRDLSAPTIMSGRSMMELKSGWPRIKMEQ